MKIIYNESRKEYIELIANAKKYEVERKNDKDGYYEIHHIFPKSVFPEYKDNYHNLVLLTYKEHFFAHKLLCDCLPCYKMKMAFSYMSCGKNRDKNILTAEEYEESKKSYKNAWNLLTDDEKHEIFSKKYNTMIERYGKGFKEIKEKEKRTRALWSEERHQQFKEKYNTTLKNHTDDERISYSNSRKNGGFAANTPSSKLKRKITNLEKYGNSNGFNVDKYRETISNKSETEIKEWKEKLSQVTKGKKYWNNGIITIRSFEKPGEDFILGRLFNIKKHADVSGSNNPRAIHIIETSENKEFGTIKDFCEYYNIKISQVRKMAIKENEKLWKIDITKI